MDELVYSLVVQAPGVRGEEALGGLEPATVQRDPPEVEVGFGKSSAVVLSYGLRFPQLG